LQSKKELQYLLKWTVTVLYTVIGPCNLG